MAKSIFDFNEDKVHNLDEKTKKSAEDLIEHYKGYSQEELMNELFRVASSEKENGTLTKEKLNNIRQSLVPYLNSNQVEFLDLLIEKLDV